MTVSNFKVFDNYEVVNNLILLNIKIVKQLSSNIYDSLMINWSNYLDKNNGKPKLERALDKVYKSLDKIDKIQIKKISLSNFNEIKEMNLDLLNKFDNSQFKVNLSQKIKESDNFYFLIQMLIELYIKEELRIKQVRISMKNNIKNQLPKIKSSVINENIVLEMELPKPRQKNINRFTVINGYIYANIDYINGVMVYNSDSFKEEIEEYNLNLLRNNNFFSNLNFPANTSLAPFEKRRRIYIQSMYELDKDLKSISAKTIDITFPVEKMFLYAKTFVDNLYKELIDETKSSKVLDYLLERTISEYGCIKKLEKYEFISNRITININKESAYVVDEILLESSRIKASGTYIDFKNIEGIFPSKRDILSILNEKITCNVNNNFLKYYNNMNFIKSVARYMRVDEICKFYNSIKECMVSSKYRISNKKYSDLQRIICELINEKIGIDINVVAKKFLKEEKMF